MSRKVLVALVAGVLPLLAACGSVQPIATPAIETPSPSPIASVETATAFPSVTPTASVTPSETPSATTTPTPSAKRTPTASATPSKTPVKVPDATPNAACASVTVKYTTKNACSKTAMELLKKAGMYTGTASTTFGTSAVNAVMNYQRSRGLADTGTIGTETWAALLTNKPMIPEVIPASCKTSGVVICANKAHRKLYWLKDGVVKKTISVRFGGFNTTKEGVWRAHPTVSGTYRVYNKHKNPCSERYGCGVMPWSTMFDPNMYVHYSGDFAKYGYSRASHGCINVKSSADAQWIYTNTPIGAKVVVY